MLCHGDTVFINGESHIVDKDDYRSLRALADNRQLDATANLSTAVMDLLYQCYSDGYIVPVGDKKQMSS